MKAIINADMFLMRTKGCEVKIVDDLGGQFSLVEIVKQPNKHKKAPNVGTKLKVSILDMDIIK